MREPKANPDCKYCHGTGIVTDYVPYGSTNVPMDSDCDCVEFECDHSKGEYSTLEFLHIADDDKEVYQCFNCDEIFTLDSVPS